MWNGQRGRGSAGRYARRHQPVQFESRPGSLVSVAKFVRNELTEPNVGRARLEPVINLDVPARVQLDAGYFESDPGRVWSASRGRKDVTAEDAPLTFWSAQANPNFVTRAPLHPEHVGR